MDNYCKKCTGGDCDDCLKGGAVKDILYLITLLRQSIARGVEKIFGEWSPDNVWLNETLYELARQCTKSKYDSWCDRSAYCDKTAEEIKIIVKQKLKQLKENI